MNEESEIRRCWKTGDILGVTIIISLLKEICIIYDTFVHMNMLQYFCTNLTLKSSI